MNTNSQMLWALLLLLLTAPLTSWAAEAQTNDPEAIAAAIRKSLPLLQKGAAGSAENRKCFTCHSQALPGLASAEAKLRGFAIDESNYQAQLQHTFKHLQRGKKSYLAGKGQGGKVETAGYALWTLQDGGWQGDETTSAVVGFILEHQKDASHWKQPSQRPPTAGSPFLSTYLALRGMGAYGVAEQEERIAARTEAATKWLLTATAADTEDRVFRLRALHYVDADEKVLDAAAAELLDSQREDGGWAQKDDMQSDAYATATALVALNRSGVLAADASAYQKGVAYLLQTQHDDGSWLVESRAKAFQTYFETGFPHGKNQFLSSSASGWATIALLLATPKK